MSEWFLVHNIDQYDSPALIVYKERVLQNIRLLKSMVYNIDRVRPHVKTNKIAEVCQMMLDEGIHKFKCATIAEAEMLAVIGAPDVLLAYQPVGPKIHRLMELIKKYPRTVFSCLVDNDYSAQQIDTLFSGNGMVMRVFIDLNVGMNRTGIAPVDALALYQSCKNKQGVRAVGLHAYDGHINDTDVIARKERIDQAFAPVAALAEAVKSATGESPVVVAGGSPTFPFHAGRKEVECSPGTFVFWDWGYKTILPDEPFDYAALLVCRVVSIIDAETICLDLGHKSVAAENPLPRVHFLNAPQAKPVGQSEEHLVVKVADSSQYKTGDAWYGVPVHICPTVALYDKVLVAAHNNITASWNVVARRRSINV
jgi:D-threonine aldolase